MKKNKLQFQFILFCIVFLWGILFSVSGIAGEKNKNVSGPQPELESNTPVLQNFEEPAFITGHSSPSGEGGSVIYLKNLPQFSKTETLEMYGAENAHIQGEMLLNQNDVESRVNSETDRYTTTHDTWEEQIPVVENLNSNTESDINISEPSDIISNSPGDYAMEWKALSNTGWYPPDTIIGVGPNHIVEAVNSGFAVYTKVGSEVKGYTTFDSFMNKPDGFQGYMFDPRVIYDAMHHRFLMLILGKDEINSKSYVWVAVSETSDPLEGWCQWRWDVTDTSGTSVAWLDYSALGADSWGVYFTGNYFYFSGGYRGAYLQTINVDIFNSSCSGDTNGWHWTDLKWPDESQAFSLQPAHPHSRSSAEQTFLVNSHWSSGNKVLLWKLSGDRTSSPTLIKTEISTSESYNAIGNNVVQKDSGVAVDGGDARIMNAVYANTRVFYTHTTDVHNDGNEAGWLTVKLNTDSNSEEWWHLLWGSDNYYIYPAITLDGSGADNSLAVFGSWSNSERYVSGLFRMYTDQPNTTDGPFVSFNSGESAYDHDVAGRNRWGDYSGAAFDWVCGFAWGAVETADISNKWRTIITARAFDDEDISCLNGIDTSNSIVPAIFLLLGD